MEVSKVNQEKLKLVNSIISEKKTIGQMELSVTIESGLTQPPIRSVFKNDQQLCVKFIKTIVRRFCDGFGFSSKPNDTLLDTITIDAFEKFQYESVEDLILFFKMARSGQLGTTNRGVDSNIIFGEWFPKYMEKKSDVREQKYNKEKDENNSNPLTMEDIKKHYEKNEKKKFHKKVINWIEKITKDMDRQMLEDTIIDWSKDEDKKPYLNLLKKKRKVIK